MAPIGGRRQIMRLYKERTGKAVSWHRLCWQAQVPKTVMCEVGNMWWWKGTEGCLNRKLKIRDESTIVSGNNNLILVSGNNNLILFSGNYGLIFLLVEQKSLLCAPIWISRLSSVFIPVNFSY